mmetsp:Transcript_21039/g.66108  ORF Transcript_21039/g.66108 Transcript_21039/m.66108 type:complete len:257 (+) Transcript_21039:575-1345(+)
MGHRIQVGGNELAAGVLVDAQLCVLDFVVVDVAVVSDDDSAHIGVVVHLCARLELHLDVRLMGPADVGHAHEVELLEHAHVPDHVHLLAGGLEVDLVHVRGCGEGGAEDLLWLDVKAEGGELALVALAGLGRVVGHEEDLLAHLAEHGDDGGHAINERVALPDHAIAVEDEDVDGIEERGCVGELRAGTHENARRSDASCAAPARGRGRSRVQNARGAERVDGGHAADETVRHAGDERRGREAEGGKRERQHRLRC